MKAIALVCALVAGPAMAQGTDAFAMWSQNSGSLPPEFAWDYTVSFYADRRGEVEYCKAYADDAPGCATARFRLSKSAFAAMRAELEPLEAALAASPVDEAVDIPVGGGSSSGRIRMNGRDLPLPAFPSPADAERVDAVMRVLRANTSDRAVRSAEAKAKLP